MLGAIIGDIAGSRFEHHNIKTKHFEFFADYCRPTDDTVMSLAVAKAIQLSGGNTANLSENAAKCMQEFGRKYPRAGYGGRFRSWIWAEDPQPYNSFGNGAAMRVSPCGYAAVSLEEAKEIAGKVTAVTHNHEEGIKAAQAVAAAVFMARSGSSMAEIRDYVLENYCEIPFTLDEIRENYCFDVTCQGSVPQAFEAFFESSDFEDAVRNAISIGGDSDTIAAIAGSIAGAYYGIPDEIRSEALSFLDEYELETLNAFEEFCTNRSLLSTD